MWHRSGIEARAFSLFKSASSHADETTRAKDEYGCGPRYGPFQKYGVSELDNREVIYEDSRGGMVYVGGGSVRDRLTWRSGLVVLGVVGAIGEALDTISIGWPALLFAAVFVVGVALTLRGGRAGVIVLGIMMLLEVVFWPAYSRDTTADWIIQTAFLVLGLAGVISAIAVLRTPRPTATA